MQTWKLTPDINPDIAPDGRALVPDRMSTHEHPKLKFNFTVQFFFRENVPSEQGSDVVADMAFAAKQATRPTPNVVLQDVNFYNFRTKVSTRLDYGTVTVTFYDDAANKAHNLYKNYLNALSPVSRSTSLAGVDNLDINGQDGTASVGPLSANRHGIIRRIRVTQHYRNGPDKTERAVHYDYLNPKVVNMILDELDMSQNDVNLVTMTFVYDSVVITEA